MDKVTKQLFLWCIVIPAILKLFISVDFGVGMFCFIAVMGMHWIFGDHLPKT